MNENKIAFWIIFSVLAFVGILWYAFENPALNPRLEEQTYKIIRKWDMPVELNEISGISWISENKIACVQDEDGIIYIYNLSTSLVEHQTNFSKAGDYEGLVVVDSTAYVLESNGEIFEVENFMSSNFTVKSFKTFFTGKNNMESLGLDLKNKRLLLTSKNKDPQGNDFKGIYAFDLVTKTVSKNPVSKISLTDPIFKVRDVDDDADKTPSFSPSDIDINPANGDIYVLQSKAPQVLIMDSLSKPKIIHNFHSDAFPQPEGITFSPEGTLYISNEGKNGTANILEVEFDE
jgi:WD40 repeat protein